VLRVKDQVAGFVAASVARTRASVEAVSRERNMKQIKGTDPVAGVPSVRRRYVDFQRICSALCRA